MPQDQVSLQTLFENLQRQMHSKLNSARECITHPGAKGDASEDCWRDMLRTHLPKRYCADKAFVIDHEGNRSHQIDIVVYDQQYSPFIFRQDSAIFVPAESVYAVIEAKQQLSKVMVEYAAEKAASVRRLKRTNANFTWAQGTMKRGDLFPIAAGVVALSSTWRPSFSEAFRTTVLSTAPNEPLKYIDFGCAVEDGAFEVVRPASGPADVFCSVGSMTLMTFFLKLVARLQALGTVPAIDISKYLASIES